MHLADPPLGGSRGTDANDVVVWFGDTRNGWPQRILTVEGVRHRSGHDPRSLHESAARQLVDQHYDLGHDMLHGSRWRPDDLGEAMPRPVSTIRDLRSIRQSPSSEYSPSYPAMDRSANPESDRGGGDRSWQSSQQQQQSRTVGDSSLGSISVRDSPSLVLQRKSEEQSTPSAAAVQSLRSDKRHRKSSLSRPPTGRSLRPTSAISTVSSQTQDTVTSSTSLTMPDARRTRSAPKTADDFPPAALCRDLDCTFALRRAAAVLDRLEPTTAPSQHPPRPCGGQHDASASNPSVRPATSSSANSTLAQLRKTLGSSMIHTIRQTNALHASEFQAKYGCKERKDLSRLQQGAEDRIAYRHLPKEEKERMQLRNDLENMQTEFARREIEAELDGFKMRVKTSLNKTRARRGALSGGGGGTTRDSDATGSSGISSSGPLTAAGLHALLQRNAASLGGGALARARADGAARDGELLREVPSKYRSHQYHLHNSVGDASGMGPIIPVQSRIQVNGKTFTYSELFRPSIQPSSTGE